MSSSFHYLVMAEHSIFQKKLIAKLKGTGLTSGQPKVLDYLKDHDGASQKDIAHGCHIEPGTLTTLLNRMEEIGLVERRMLGGNRRSFYVFMTDLGKSKLKLVTDAFNELEEEAFSDISAEDRENFMDLFQKIYKNTAHL
ncbi:MAG TPA: MarR family transcriptional regulator [Candidatus Mediterraneibacter gallistercoris]|uniref:MarR family transcriptional regulator n=1 Tax=Candidatus Mediterraneibacter gallistercoris TaxID=2838671 RepID=A0A9D2T2M8_9FIRM|nr:MarR family transcriptional regulator [Candidatus Mediterraneibacter gallistercoris]